MTIYRSIPHPSADDTPSILVGCLKQFRVSVLCSWVERWHWLSKTILPKTKHLAMTTYSRILLSSKITQLLPYLATLHELQASCHVGCRRPIFGANWKIGDTKCLIFFTFCNLIWFWEFKFPCREYLMQSAARTFP